MSTATAPLTVTDAAARKIAQLAAKDGRTEPILRLRVVAGGCSGFSYELGFDEAGGAEDHVIAGADGGRGLGDPRSAPIIEGSLLELDPSLLRGGLEGMKPPGTPQGGRGR